MSSHFERSGGVLRHAAQLLCVAVFLLACSKREDSTTLSSVSNPSRDEPAGSASGDQNAQALTPSDSASPASASAADAVPLDTNRFVLASIVIDADGNRVSYAQLVDSLGGHFQNSGGIEAPGNAAFLAHGEDFFYGLQESPEWVRYSTRGGFQETGRLSFANYGITSMDYANAILDAETAVSVLTSTAQAIVWNPSTMSVTGVIDLPQLVQPGYELEAYTTVAHAGLVYVPGKWVNWDAGEVMQRVSMTILDPKTLSIAGVTEDDRCGAGGRVTFDRQGNAYVMGDGRNQSMQVFAAARGEATVSNCLLRIPAGQTQFDPGYYYEIPSLTGGLDSMTELVAASLDDGIAFSMMMYPDRIPADLDRVNFEHWDVPAYKLWRIVLGDTPSAEPVTGVNFSVVGFDPIGVAGKLYSSESADGSQSDVYEIDPQTNTATLRFSVDGYFADLLPITSATP